MVMHMEFPARGSAIYGFCNHIIHFTICGKEAAIKIAIRPHCRAAQRKKQRQQHAEQLRHSLSSWSFQS